MIDDERAEGGAGVAGGPPASAPSGELAGICRRVVLWYAAVAATWIVASDLAVSMVRNEDVEQQALDVVKGLVFVLVTAAVLWVVLRRLTRSYDKHFAREVTAQRDFYQSILSTSTDLVLIFGADGLIRYANRALVEILGWDHDAVIGRRGRDFLHPDDVNPASSFRANLELGGSNRRTFRMAHRDGTYRTLEMAMSSIPLGDGTEGAVIVARDVTERARGEQQLRAALAEDVTGLPNLRMFVAEMERLAEVTAVGLDAVVLLVDIDRFGDINALHGRVGGDAVLLELSRRMEAALPEAIGLWRHGADEILAVLLEDPAQTAAESGVGLARLIERVQHEAAAPIAIDDSDRRLSVSVSVGLARLPVDCGVPEDSLSSQMLRTAEEALVEAKQHPDRSAVRVQGDAGAGSERALVIEQLHRAVERGELVVHFQPKVRLADLCVVGAEALVRWQHPDRGLLLPDEFLRAVDEANLTAAMTRSVLQNALAQVPGWLGAAGCAADFEVSVNISLDDLRRRRFVDDVFDALHESGVEARHLCLELTEQTMLADALGASTVVAELRRAGIRVAIDDFGTGYSSLEHIRIFEVDELKIDKGFVQQIGRSRTDEAIVDSILAIAGRLGVKVTAEGIETSEALEYLRQRGCHDGQGFLFSAAVPVEEFAPGRSWATLP
ncbi:EAL domain-containing protein [Acidimicrobiia bacterium EGI L10123]|uniref:putative bifunctional diguanylate cyclase/phosphodiesterase n=1 Tax=Salinilacustrithrix flava TaxID=2957203 RepID=UPI003D7C17A9|nr:EAL domain-containing protein [Acidimicrobiia bacterium EGI L10123]